MTTRDYVLRCKSFDVTDADRALAWFASNSDGASEVEYRIMRDSICSERAPGRWTNAICVN
jgi:hypothetical protein